MADNAILNATAILGAITPNTSSHTKEAAIADKSGSNNSSAFGKYNKQMLISNYLNRGK
ncbi:hypothetical protein DFH28DRAFT_867526, partial [Melampsora americana]